MHLSCFLAASTPNSKLSLLQSWHSRGKPEDPKFLTLLHLLSVYLNRILRFVCCSKFAITLTSMQLFVYRNSVEQKYLTFSTYAIRIPLHHVIFQLSFIELQNSLYRVK